MTTWATKGRPVTAKFRSDFQGRPYNEVFRQARVAAGLTLKQLGVRSDIHPGLVASVELFHHYPSQPQQEALAKALGLRVGDLFAPWQQVFSSKAKAFILPDDSEGWLPIESLGYSTLNKLARVDVAEVALARIRQRELKALLGQMLMGLRADRRRVLQLRFGLIDGRQRTLEQVAMRVGQTRENIRQAETVALRRLRWMVACDPLGQRLQDFLHDEVTKPLRSLRPDPPPQLLATPVADTPLLVSIRQGDAWPPAGKRVQPPVPQGIDVRTGQPYEPTQRPYRRGKVKALIVAPGVLTFVGEQRFVDSLPVTEQGNRTATRLRRQTPLAMTPAAIEFRMRAARKILPD